MANGSSDGFSGSSTRGGRDDRDRAPRPMVNRVPPHNLSAEESVLGSILLSRDALDQIAELGLNVEHFYKPAHQHIFDAIRGLMATGNGAGGGVLCALKSGWIVGIAIMGLFASIWPGMIAKSQQWPPFWNTDDAFLIDDGGDSSSYLYGGIAMAVISFLLLVLCIVAYLMPSCTPVVPVMASGFGNRLVASTR